MKKKLFSRPGFLGGSGISSGGGDKKGVSGWIRRHIPGANKEGEKGDRSTSKDRDHNADNNGDIAVEGSETGEYSATDYEMEAYGDLW